MHGLTGSGPLAECDTCGDTVGADDESLVGEGIGATDGVKLCSKDGV